MCEGHLRDCRAAPRSQRSELKKLRSQERRGSVTHCWPRADQPAPFVIDALCMPDSPPPFPEIWYGSAQGWSSHFPARCWKMERCMLSHLTTKLDNEMDWPRQQKLHQQSRRMLSGVSRSSWRTQRTRQRNLIGATNPNASSHTRPKTFERALPSFQDHSHDLLSGPLLTDLS